MSRRRQNRLRTFGWRAEACSPVTHNQGALERRAWQKARKAMRGLELAFRRFVIGRSKEAPHE